MKKDLEIVFSEQVLEQMAANPELAEATREMVAMMHQAQHGVDTGKYANFDDAMEAISGSRPEKIEEE